MDGMSQKVQGMSEVPLAALCAASNIERTYSLLELKKFLTKFSQLPPERKTQ